MVRISAVDVHGTSSAYFAPATVAEGGRLVHVTGQPGSTNDGTIPDDYESQIHLALLKLRKIIIAAGGSVQQIAKLTLFIVNYDASTRKHTRRMMKFLGGHRPAITLVPCPQLAAPTWQFEVEAVLSVPARDSVQRSLLPAPKESVDVVIIGAGLAGLSAAEALIRKGYSCVVLEARDRVGGKTWSVPTEDGQGHVDLGAAWINDTNQSKVYGLAKRFGAELLEQNTQGHCVLEDQNGICEPFAYGELPNFDAATRKHCADIRDMVEADCQAVDTWEPTDTSLDSLTFEAYLVSRGANAAAVATATVWTRAMLGQDPKDISALYFLNYCKSGGGLLQMRSDRKDGGQYLRVRQGTQLFSTGLASTLPQDVVRLSCPVRHVAQYGRQSVRVQAGDRTFLARKVITTVPSPVLTAITWEPKLPAAKQLWAQSTTYGYYTKAMMQFEKPFWVENGFCGLAQSFVGPASVVRDSASPKDNKYILTCFMSGDPGIAWSALSQSDRENALLRQLEKLYKVDDLSSIFVRMYTYEWTDDEFSGWGCPCTSLTPGVLDTVGPNALREAWSNVHFAGTETAGEWKGYMEGAIRSGERAAEEVVKDLATGLFANL